MGMDKSQLRQQYVAKRHQVDPKTRETLSRRIADSLTQLSSYPTSSKIGLYAASPEEVDLHHFFERCAADGKSCYFPRVTGELLAFHRVITWSDLVVGAYGILAPSAQAEVLAPEHCDLIIVPGVAFDRHGNRLGRGKGYYDRFLPAVGGTRVGICFDCCVVEELPSEPHDARMDVLVTESGVMRF